MSKEGYRILGVAFDPNNEKIINPEKALKIIFWRDSIILKIATSDK